MQRKKKRENGAIVIEATISLSAFMFAIVTVLTIVNICIVQARITNAVNLTAKEISQYSYLYSLTGLNETQQNMVESGKNNTAEAKQVLQDVNSIYNQIEKIAGQAQSSDISIESVQAQWEDINSAISQGKSVAFQIEDLAKDPKKIIFGVAQLAGSGAMDFAKSKLIAEPLAKVLCKKHLVDKEHGDVEAYLKGLGVQPKANGSYFDGLDFSNSYLFPNGSNEITISVRYKVKVIALLPVDFSFTFHQTAITHGWLAGDTSYRSNKDVIENKTTWTELTVQERANLIRHNEMDKLLKENYYKTKGLTDVPLYNPKTKEFVMISSMNPLYSGPNEPTKTLEDVSPEAIQKAIESLCGKIKSTTTRANPVQIKIGDEVQEYSTKGAENKVVLVIPEDEGLKEIIQAAVDQAKKNDVTVEIITGYGNGANKTVQGETQ